MRKGEGRGRSSSGGQDPAFMHEAEEEMVSTSTSAMALAERALPGVGPDLRVTLPADGHDWPLVARASSVGTHHRQAELPAPGRRELPQQRQVIVSPSKGEVVPLQEP